MAAEWKAKGNAALTAGQFDTAIEAYSKAIELDSSDHVFYSNRSAAYLSKGDAELALQDGEKCVELSPAWPKGHGRKGAALHALRRYDDATAAYNAGLTVAPDDAGLKSGLAEVQKAMTAKPVFGGGGGGGGLFGPQLLSKLAGHPKFGPKLADPTFMTKLQMVQSNPQLLMSDPEMMEVLQVILGGNGGAGGGDDDDDDQPFRPAQSSASSSSAAAAAAAPSSKKAEPLQSYDEDLTEEEREVKKCKREAVAAKERGNALYKEKKFSEAIAAYDEAYKLDKNMMFLNNKAAVLIEMGQCTEAIALCMEAIEVTSLAA